MGAPNETVAAAILGSVVSNAGNFGIPVAHLLYVEGGTLFGGQPEYRTRACMSMRWW